MHYYYFPNSHWSRAISLVIAEKNISVTRHLVDIRKNASFEPEYMRLNPKGVVPTLVEDGKPICNALNIATHLDTKDPVLYSGLESAEVDGWVDRLESFPLMLFSYSVWTKGLKGEKSADILADKVTRAKKYAEEHADLRELYQRKQEFFEEFRGQVYDKEHVAKESRRWSETLEEMGKLCEERGWLCGSDYSFADCIATSILYRLMDLELLDEWSRDDDHPLSQYLKRVKARPNFKAVWQDDPLLASLS